MSRSDTKLPYNTDGTSKCVPYRTLFSAKLDYKILGFGKNIMFQRVPVKIFLKNDHIRIDHYFLSQHWFFQYYLYYLQTPFPRVWRTVQTQPRDNAYHSKVFTFINITDQIEIVLTGLRVMFVIPVGFNQFNDGPGVMEYFVFRFGAPQWARLFYGKVISMYPDVIQHDFQQLMKGYPLPHYETQVAYPGQFVTEAKPTSS